MAAVHRQSSATRRSKSSHAAKLAGPAVGGFGRMLAKLSVASGRLESARRRTKR